MICFKPHSQKEAKLRLEDSFHIQACIFYFTVETWWRLCRFPLCPPEPPSFTVEAFLRFKEGLATAGAEKVERRADKMALVQLSKGRLPVSLPHSDARVE